jgi:hypothetical protein
MLPSPSSPPPGPAASPAPAPPSPQHGSAAGAPLPPQQPAAAGASVASPSFPPPRAQQSRCDSTAPGPPPPSRGWHLPSPAAMQHGPAGPATAAAAAAALFIAVSGSAGSAVAAPTTLPVPHPACMQRQSQPLHPQPHVQTHDSLASPLPPLPLGLDPPPTAPPPSTCTTRSFTSAPLAGAAAAHAGPPAACRLAPPCPPCGSRPACSSSEAPCLPTDVLPTARSRRCPCWSPCWRRRCAASTWRGAHSGMKTSTYSQVTHVRPRHTHTAGGVGGWRRRGGGGRGREGIHCEDGEWPSARPTVSRPPALLPGPHHSPQQHPPDVMIEIRPPSTGPTIMPMEKPAKR